MLTALVTGEREKSKPVYRMVEFYYLLLGSSQKGSLGGCRKEVKCGQTYRKGEGLCNLCRDPTLGDSHFLK